VGDAAERHDARAWSPQLQGGGLLRGCLELDDELGWYPAPILGFDGLRHGSVPDLGAVQPASTGPTAPGPPPGSSSTTRRSGLATGSPAGGRSAGSVGHRSLVSQRASSLRAQRNARGPQAGPRHLPVGLPIASYSRVSPGMAHRDQPSVRRRIKPPCRLFALGCRSGSVVLGVYIVRFCASSSQVARYGLLCGMPVRWMGRGSMDGETAVRARYAGVARYFEM